MHVLKEPAAATSLSREVLLRDCIDHTIDRFLPVENECYLLARSTSNPDADENERSHVLELALGFTIV